MCIQLGLEIAIEMTVRTKNLDWHSANKSIIPCFIADSDTATSSAARPGCYPFVGRPKPEGSAAFPTLTSSKPYNDGCGPRGRRKSDNGTFGGVGGVCWALAPN